MEPEEFKFNWLRDNKTRYEEETESHYFTGELDEAIEFLYSVHEVGLPLVEVMQGSLISVYDGYGSYYGAGETLEEAKRYLVGAVLHS